MYQLKYISNHPPRAGRDNLPDGDLTDDLVFQSTRPVRGGTPLIEEVAEKPKRFQSTRPVRGGTTNWASTSPKSRFQSTRPVRGGTSLRHRMRCQLP